MTFWETLKLARCEYLRRIGECKTPDDKLPCSAMNERGLCTAIIIDLDPCGVSWEKEVEIT